MNIDWGRVPNDGFWMVWWVVEGSYVWFSMVLLVSLGEMSAVVTAGMPFVFLAAVSWPAIGWLVQPTSFLLAKFLFWPCFYWCNFPTLSFTANNSIFCQLRIPINIINPHFEMLALIFYLAQVAQWEFFQPPLGRFRIPGTPLVSGTPVANSSAREKRRRGRPCSSCCGKRRRPFGRRFFLGRKLDI